MIKGAAERELGGASGGGGGRECSSSNNLIADVSGDLSGDAAVKRRSTTSLVTMCALYSDG
jgi:hypothetical protein